MTTIYPASKAIHGPKWIALREKGWPIVAGWIDLWPKGSITDWPAHWDMCVNEAAKATYCLAYCEPDDILKGALVEIGVAIANQRKVLYVGDYERYTIARHPQVTIFATIEDALTHIQRREWYNFLGLRNLVGIQLKKEQENA